MRVVLSATGLLALAAACSGGVPITAPGCPSACGQWRTVPRTAGAPGPRYQGYALLRHGLVHYLGGVLPASGQPPVAANDNVDILDPASGAWSAGPPMPADAPTNHLAVTVQDDTIYVLGGYTIDATGNMIVLATCYALDDAGWHRLADAPVARQGAAAQSIGGKIYVAGGGTGEMAAIADLFVYDPATDAWSAGPPLPTARSHVASCLLDGKMIVAGGFRGANPSVETMATVEAFDPATGAWTSLPDMPTARGALGAAVLGGVCYTIGGFSWAAPSRIFAALEAFDPGTGAWETHAPMLLARHSAGVVAVDASLYTLGGSPNPFQGFSDDFEIYAP